MTAILTVNPGSTTTKVALFDDETLRFDREVSHPREELDRFDSVADQMPYRLGVIREVLREENCTHWDAVCGRGGLLRPLTGGLYAVNDAMISDMLMARYGEHPCNLGAPLARELAEAMHAPAYIADPVVTDEMDDRARLTGLPSIRRRSVFHALNQKGAARRVCRELGMEPAEASLIVIHIGGGISVGAHRRGRVADVINALDGEGPFTPERTGSLPTIPVLEMVKGGTAPDELKQTVLRKGGIFAYLGTNDLREVARRIESEDEQAAEVFEAFTYSMAKSVLSLLPALAPLLPDAIVVTGGASKSEMLVQSLRELVEHVAPVFVIPGSVEMESLAAAAFEGLHGGTINEY